MEHFKKFAEKHPETAKMLTTRSKEEILEHYALLAEEKDQLAEYKDDNEFFKKDLEHIINLAIEWMRENNMDNHHLYIKDGKSKLIYSKIEERFI